ncbi:MAG: peroxiredoxin family protein [candidate division KSB1 bacterium]|nr:peroxiredoxin family protein [candidate division KSB1 bacterium]
MHHHQPKSLLLLFYYLIFSLTLFAKDDPQIGLEPGNILPSFKLPDLNDKLIALEEFRGQIVVIHLWKCQ